MSQLLRCVQILVASLATIAVGACGGGSGGGTPTSPTTVARSAITIASITTNGTRTTAGFELTVTLRLRETGGQAATVNSALLQLLDAQGTAIAQVTFDNPLGGSNRIAPQQELSTRTLTATAGSDIQYPAAIRATVAFVDDGQTAGSATSTVPIQPLQTATVTGVVRNGVSNAPLTGATVSVTAGPSSGRTTTTDGNGFYSLPVDFGPINLRFDAPGFSPVVRAFTVSGNSTVDVNLTPPTAPSPAVEYRVIGSRADLTYVTSQGGTAQAANQTLPWSYTMTFAQTGQFLYISAQNTGDSGPITVQIYRRGVLFRTTTSTGAFAIATASGSF